MTVSQTFYIWERCGSDLYLLQNYLFTTRPPNRISTTAQRLARLTFARYYVEHLPSEQKHMAWPLVTCGIVGGAFFDIWLSFVLHVFFYF